MIGSLFLSVLFCYLIIYFTRKNKWIDKPRKDRWNNKKVPKFGGLGLFFAFIITTLSTVELSNYVLLIISMTSITFLIGFIDDLYNIKPVTKILFIILLSIFCFIIDFRFFPSGPIYLSLPLTILWFSGIINAVNIIDNMDGLSVGTSIITLCLIIYFSSNNDQMEILNLSTILLGACLGFLFFNFHPAKLFMGDTGSLFIGFLLATFSLEIASSEGKNIIFTLFFPVLVMAYPIFDTFLVTINRIKNNRPVSEGGSDHSSHRLVRIGMSERKAVLFLYLISITFGLIALQFEKVNIRLFSSTLIIFTLGLIGLGLFISNYRINAGKVNKSIAKTSVFINNIYMYKKQIIELFFDALLIISSFTFSHYLRFEDSSNLDIWSLHDRILPLVISIKLITFYSFKLYRGFWQYASIQDLVNVFKASIVSTVVITFCLFFTQIELYSRSIFMIDFILTFILISSLRFFYRLIISLLSSKELKEENKTLLLGTGDLLDILTRYTLIDKELGFRPTGIIIKEEGYKGRSLHNIPILGGLNDFKSVLVKQKISRVISSFDINDPSVRVLKDHCLESNISFKTINISFK
ncbi:hypothetical protein N9N24_05255 [Candidatus Marinimicrobia bacterium]|nr:hypothetical protein [Candidatus Neomarinimicrobiota bacterium]